MHTYTYRMICITCNIYAIYISILAGVLQCNRRMLVVMLARFRTSVYIHTPIIKCWIYIHYLKCRFTCIFLECIHTTFDVGYRCTYINYAWSIYALHLIRVLICIQDYNLMCVCIHAYTHYLAMSVWCELCMYIHDLKEMAIYIAFNVCTRCISWVYWYTYMIAT